jgi:hypothetical protein
MRKKKKIQLVCWGLLATALVLMALIVLVRHEPAFYHRAEVAPGKIRQEMSAAFTGRFASLCNNWQEGRGEWEVTFTEQQINSYFVEDFIKGHNMAEVLSPHGVTEPRIAIENDKLRLAFRYGRPPWSTIISYDLKLWVAPNDLNVVCVEFLGRHAGALPIATQALLNEISEVARRNGFEVTWHRHQGNPVAVVRIQQGNRAHAPPRLRRLEVKQGWMTIGGVSQVPDLTDSGKRVTAPMGN